MKKIADKASNRGEARLLINLLKEIALDRSELAPKCLEAITHATQDHFYYFNAILAYRTIGKKVPRIGLSV